MRVGRLAGLTALLLVLLLIVALTGGPLALAPIDLLDAARGEAGPEVMRALGLRVPRVIVALTCGAALAGAGAALQIAFRNPLVAPDLLGVSSGAGLGAALSLIVGAGLVGVQAGAFAGGMAAALLALACARVARGRDPHLTLVLCGIVVGALASAGLALLLVLADPYSELPAITFWLLGSFGRAEMGEALAALAGGAIGLGGLLWLGFRLAVLALGDDQARALGFAAGRLRMLTVVAAALATAASVAACGVVGWIGLIAPHAARLFAGERAGRLIPASIALGACFALGIDRISAAGSAEIPVGLLAAAIGAPGFLALFVRAERRAA